MKISDIRAMQPEPKKIVLRGQPAEMGFVSAADTIAIQRAMPRPNTGRADQRNDPLHRAAEARWTGRFYAAVVGVSLGLTRDDGSAWEPKRDREWVEAYADEISAAFSEAEVTRLFLLLDKWLADLAGDARLIGASKDEPDALGN